MKHNRQNKILRSFALVSVLTVVSVLIPNRVLASNLIAGRITDSINCTCTFSKKITVEGPYPGTFMKAPFVTRVYDYRKLEEGKNVIGLVGTGEYPCKAVTVKSLAKCAAKALIGLPCDPCEDKGSAPIIAKIGTSK